MHTITKKQQENLLEAARLIEANPEHFDMRTWFCGTSACIAGYAIMVDRKRKSVPFASKWFNDLCEGDRDHHIRQACGFRDDYLFIDWQWHDCLPQSLYLSARKERDRINQAKSAADYVRWFVENHTKVEEQSK
jgi:hypothetical protein